MKRITRVKAIRLKCLDCTDTFTDIKDCEFIECFLYPYRMGRRPKTELIPSKAIRKYCINDCMNNQPYEVKNCIDSECSLFNYRMGVEIKDRNNSIKSSSGFKTKKHKDSKSIRKIA